MFVALKRKDEGDQVEGLARRVGLTGEPDVQFRSGLEAESPVQCLSLHHDRGRVEDHPSTVLRTSSSNTRFHQGAPDTPALACRVHGEHANASTLGIVELAHGPFGVGYVPHTPHERSFVVECDVDFAVKVSTGDVAEFVLVGSEGRHSLQVAVGLNRDSSEGLSFVRLNPADVHVSAEPITDGLRGVRISLERRSSNLPGPRNTSVMSDAPTHLTTA